MKWIWKQEPAQKAEPGEDSSPAAPNGTLTRDHRSTTEPFPLPTGDNIYHRLFPVCNQQSTIQATVNKDMQLMGTVLVSDQENSIV